MKGKDPQQKALDLNLPSTGVVIHKVTEEVDSGEVIVYNTINILRNETIDSLCGELRKLSISLWVPFLKEKIIEKAV